MVRNCSLDSLNIIVKMIGSGRKQIHLSHGAQHTETQSFLRNREDVLE